MGSFLPLYFPCSSAFFSAATANASPLDANCCYCLAGFGLKIVNTDRKILVLDVDGKGSLPNTCIHGGCWSSAGMAGWEETESS